MHGFQQVYVTTVQFALREPERDCHFNLTGSNHDWAVFYISVRFYENQFTTFLNTLQTWTKCQFRPQWQRRLTIHKRIEIIATI